MRLLITYGRVRPLAQADGDAATPPSPTEVPTRFDDPYTLLASLAGAAEALARVVRVADQREAQWLRARESAGIAYAE